MKLEKGKWYVCINSWSDDGWCKFNEGDVVQCEHDDEIKDCYGVTHVFKEHPEHIFREATESESNLANCTNVNIDEFVRDIDSFESQERIIDIYRYGAENMLKYIRSKLTVK
jgi:hypothetical protein